MHIASMRTPGGVIKRLWTAVFALVFGYVWGWGAKMDLTRREGYEAGAADAFSACAQTARFQIERSTLARPKLARSKKEK